MGKNKKQWRDLPPAARGIIAVGGTADLVLRAWAIVDLIKRPQDQIRGSKAVWAVALAVVNSAGAVPIAYLTWARQLQD
ncbi:hypothetical protein Rai3103_14115 [Raineyella fluvialis]|uniref:DUF5652 domain-containing protein n=2 Tax=Raineyella fluvialis TaxID=2662261 RepID=A0A5Q2FEM8_9ACTN|nr:hypothetical protein Rai3103_14115 [Raineyella fluvialis]